MMQTNITMEIKTDGLIRDISVCTVEHDRLAVIENSYEVGESMEVTLKNDIQSLGITSNPPSLLSVTLDKVILSMMCTAMFMVNPEGKELEVGHLGSLIASCNIHSATKDDDAGTITLVLDMTGINYAKLVGTSISGHKSVEGEFFYFIFGNYSEMKVYLVDVATHDENGVRYEYEDDVETPMNEIPITSPALTWARSGTVATIQHDNHGHTAGGYVDIKNATTSGTPSTALPDGTYKIKAKTKDTYTVDCLDSGETSGILDETYIYGEYQNVGSSLIAAAMQRCINAMYDEPVVTVEAVHGSIEITSLVAGVNNMIIPYDYESASTILGFDNAYLIPCIDISGKNVCSSGIPCRTMLSSGGNEVVISSANVTVGTLADTRLFIIDVTQDTTIKVTQT